MPSRSIAAGIALAALATVAPPGAASADEQVYRGGRTGDLAAICAAAGADAGARGWCHGFLVATGQYHRSVTAPESTHQPLVCLPDPAPTLAQARDAFVAWARANPQYADSRAVDGLMRFAAATWPCPPRTAPAARRR